MLMKFVRGIRYGFEMLGTPKQFSFSPEYSETTVTGSREITKKLSEVTISREVVSFFTCEIGCRE